MTKAHETPFTPGQQATMTSRLAVALPGALELLAKSGIGIKPVLSHTKEGERLEYALAMAIRALYNGHADTIPPNILTHAKAVNFPGGVIVKKVAFVPSLVSYSPTWAMRDLEKLVFLEKSVGFDKRISSLSEEPESDHAKTASLIAITETTDLSLMVSDVSRNVAAGWSHFFAFLGCWEQLGVGDEGLVLKSGNKYFFIRDRDEALIIQALWQAPAPGLKASHIWRLSLVSSEDVQLKYGDQFVYLSDNGS